LITLKIRHKTTYRFYTAVSPGPHRLMLRPRESRDLRLISSNVTVTPAAAVTWAHDVFGNAVATATFQGMSTHIEIDSIAELELDAVAWPVFDIAASAIYYPFRYSDKVGAQLTLRWRGGALEEINLTPAGLVSVRARIKRLISSNDCGARGFCLGPPPKKTVPLRNRSCDQQSAPPI
jgi:transglutaminase-like putative cysteine protease